MEGQPDWDGVARFILDGSELDLGPPVDVFEVARVWCLDVVEGRRSMILGSSIVVSRTKPLTSTKVLSTVITKVTPKQHRLACAKRLRSFRESKGWTRTELAEQCGVTQGFISQLERGKKSVGLRLAVEIERLSGDWAAGPIKHDEWILPAERPSGDEAA